MDFSHAPNACVLSTLMLATSTSKSLKRSSSASYEGSCAEHTRLKAKGTKASTTFFLPRKSLRCQVSPLAVFNVKSGALSPTFSVFVSVWLFAGIKHIPSLDEKYERVNEPQTRLLFISTSQRYCLNGRIVLQGVNYGAYNKRADDDGTRLTRF